jgi:hypothetical protein
MAVFQTAGSGSFPDTRTRSTRPRCFGSMPECHSGRPGSTPGGRTPTCRSGDQRCLQNGACAVRFRGTSPCTSRWLGGPPSKRARGGSNPSWCTMPRSTSGEVIGLSSRSDGLDTHTRCPVSAGGSGGLATNEAGGGSTPPGDTARLSPADLAATLRTSHSQFDSARGHQRAWSNGGSLLSYGRNRPFRVRRSLPFPTTPSGERALIRRSARARLPPSGPFWDRLMVGREPLTLVIVVRIHVPEPRGAPRLVLGMLLQSVAARFDLFLVGAARAAPLRRSEFGEASPHAAQPSWCWACSYKALQLGSIPRRRTMLPPTSGEEPGLMNLADGFDTRAADVYAPQRGYGAGPDKSAQQGSTPWRCTKAKQGKW